MPNKSSFNSTTIGAGEVQQNLYHLYGNAGFSLDLVANVGIRWLCATIAALANFSLVYMTVRSKNLNTSCNKLIALDSLYAGAFQLSVTITFSVVLSGQNFIPLSNCLPLQLIPLMGFFLCQCATLFIAVDRLLCVLFPIWINQKKQQKILFSAMVIVGLFYALCAIALCIGISISNSKKLVQCGTGDCFPDEVGDFLNKNQLYLFGITAGCYPSILLAFMFRNKHGNAAAVVYTRKMMKSLLIIIFVLFISQASTSISRLLGFQ